MAIMTHKITVNLDLDRRKKLEVVRTFLTLNHPAAAFTTFTDVFAFLLDTAPLAEMLAFINGASPQEGIPNAEPGTDCSGPIADYLINGAGEPDPKPAASGRKRRKNAAARVAAEQG